MRIFMDAGKVSAYPTLNAWYTNDPSYRGGVDGRGLLEEILEAGRDVMSRE